MSPKTVLKFKKLRDGAVLPSRATDGSAAADLRACLDAPVVIEPGERRLIPTGLAMEIPEPNLVALVFSRSGNGIKHGVTLANSVGVIDSDYRGEIGVVLVNHGNEPFSVGDKDRIAQLLLTYALPFAVEESEELSDTERGSGGYGSTGVK